MKTVEAEAGCAAHSSRPYSYSCTLAHAVSFSDIEIVPRSCQNFTGFILRPVLTHEKHETFPLHGITIADTKLAHENPGWTRCPPFWSACHSCTYDNSALTCSYILCLVPGICLAYLLCCRLLGPDCHPSYYNSTGCLRTPQNPSSFYKISLLIGIQSYWILAWC